VIRLVGEKNNVWIEFLNANKSNSNYSITNEYSNSTKSLSYLKDGNYFDKELDENTSVGVQNPQMTLKSKKEKEAATQTQRVENFKSNLMKVMKYEKNNEKCMVTGVLQNNKNDAPYTTEL
jgi:hypothetical protein